MKAPQQVCTVLTCSVCSDLWRLEEEEEEEEESWQHHCDVDDYIKK